LLPIYQYSNLEKFYSVLYLEHHFNGFLTNKIPGFKKLNWYLVAGFNAFYLDKNKNYQEYMIGFENILKQFRIDIVRGSFKGQKATYDFRIGLRRPLGKIFDDWPLGESGVRSSESVVHLPLTIHYLPNTLSLH
jgi:hypothetical protein